MTKKEKIFQVVSKELLKLIADGKYKAGEKLPTEMELAEQFGVSRLPIREALSVLRATGVIISKQGGGSYVADIPSKTFLQGITIENKDIENIKYLFELRKALEPEAAYLAATRRLPEQIEEMKSILQQLEKESVKEGKSGIFADIDFHRSVVRATNNPIMIQVFDNLSALYENTLKITLQPNSQLENKRISVFREHQGILEAIELEEPELARIQCIIHLRNAEKKLGLFIKDFVI
ncbi:FadR/GntR family transcriptional regulator [Neobacillus drentensis]|jgi:GntR family transcriptional regulator, transcriptional repressor for pyruvate dehydrogenase complex|uniref:FadR/GntR family transcriptional regulator n=1 Tax=Neobacillus drentensis TaxID=220684 RepID=UPI000BF2ACFA|nr:GntR family transcriptional regulator [Bacillus sp. AFS006103]